MIAVQQAHGGAIAVLRLRARAAGAAPYQQRAPISNGGSGRAAAELIEDGDTVFIGSGTAPRSRSRGTWVASTIWK